MLHSLGIENYALIDALNIDFSQGLNILTGETGAGKSIILGALSLVLGQRASTGILKDPSRPCFIEAEFSVEEDSPSLQKLFADNEIDYCRQFAIQRVVMPSGRSRALINEEPVGLNFLKDLAPHLIDIHGQHQQLLLGNPAFQMHLLDSCADNKALLRSYREVYRALEQLEQEYDHQNRAYSMALRQQDYLAMESERIEKAGLQEGELENLEQEQHDLSHLAQTKQLLYALSEDLSQAPEAVVGRLKQIGSLVEKAADNYSLLRPYVRRMESVYIELQDIARDMERFCEQVDPDPQRLEQVNERLDLLYTLLARYKLRSIPELMAHARELKRQISGMDNQAAALADLQKQIRELQDLRGQKAAELHARRQKAAPGIVSALEKNLFLLGIPYARVKFELQSGDVYNSLGNTTLRFLFSSNREMPLREVTEVASGGELSRLMLCLKALLAKNGGEASLIFDEIDSGVSGPTAYKMGNMICALSDSRQVVAITHLPQVAAKGNDHWLVYKEHDLQGSRTCVKKLEAEEREREIARMLSGESITPQAIAQAKVLLQNR